MSHGSNEIIRLRIRVLLLALLAAALGQSIYAYVRLPAWIPTHFGPLGQADAWIARTALLGIYFVVVAGTTSIALLLPWAVNRWPEALITLPHRDHWLAPERRTSTLSIVARQMMWFGIVTTGLTLLFMHLLLRVILSGGLDIPTTSMGALLVTYVTYCIAWGASLWLRFSAHRAR